MRAELRAAQLEAQRVFHSELEPQSPEFTAAARGWMASWVYAEPPLLAFAHERWVLHPDVAASLLARAAAIDDDEEAAFWALQAGGRSDADDAIRDCVVAVLEHQEP